MLGSGKWLVSCVRGKVLARLLDGRHAREHGDDVGEVPAEAIRPLGLRRIRLCLHERLGGLFGQRAELTATRGLHDDDGLAVLLGHLHEAMGLVVRVIPIEVVNL